MDETNFDWDDLRLFLAVARGGGLGPAVAATGKSAPTLGRRMLALEARLGRELFRRLPRGYALTEDGQALLSRLGAIEATLLPMIEGAARAPLVKISAGPWVARVLCRRVGEIVGGAPVRLRFISALETLDIGRREALIGVRNRRPEGAGLAGRRVGRVRFAVYARDRKVETWARVTGAAPSARWVRDQAGDAAGIEVTDPGNALDLVRSGAARGVFPTFIGDAEPDLARVSPPIEALDHDQWLVTHHEDRFIPEVRGVIDRVYAVLKATLTA